MSEKTISRYSPFKWGAEFETEVRRRGGRGWVNRSDELRMRKQVRSSERRRILQDCDTKIRSNDAIFIFSVPDLVRRFRKLFLRTRIRILPTISKNMKKNLDFYCFATFYLFYFWRIMQMCLQKGISLKNKTLYEIILQTFSWKYRNISSYRYHIFLR